MDVLDFNYFINQLLDKISKEKKQIYVLGDFNINLLNLKKKTLWPLFFYGWGSTVSRLEPL